MGDDRCSGEWITRRQMLGSAAAFWSSRVVPSPRSSRCLASNDLHPAHVTAVRFAPGGQQIVIGSQAGVEVRDAKGKNILRRIPTELENVHDLCFSPAGDLIAIAGGTPGEWGAVEWFHWPDASLQHRVEGHDDVVYQVAIAADGSRWVAASADEVCTVYDKKDRVATTRYTQHSRAVLAVTILPDGETAVSASRDETLRVWNCLSGESLRTLHNHSRDVNALALQPGQRKLPMVASASADRTVRFWQPTIGRMVRFARLSSEPLAIAWIGGGTRVIAVCRDGKARLIDPTTVKVAETRDVAPGWLYAVDVDGQSKRQVVIGGSRGLVEVFSV